MQRPCVGRVLAVAWCVSECLPRSPRLLCRVSSRTRMTHMIRNHKSVAVYTYMLTLVRLSVVSGVLSLRMYYKLSLLQTPL